MYLDSDTICDTSPLVNLVPLYPILRTVRMARVLRGSQEDGDEQMPVADYCTNNNITFLLHSPFGGFHGGVISTLHIHR